MNEAGAGGGAFPLPHHCVGQPAYHCHEHGNPQVLQPGRRGHAATCNTIVQSFMLLITMPLGGITGEPRLFRLIMGREA